MSRSMWGDCDHRCGNVVRWVHVLAGVVALCSLLATRNLPSAFLEDSGFHVSVQTASQDKSLRFNCDRLDTIIPSSQRFPVPSAETIRNVVAVSQDFAQFQTKGFHYNRPPPAA